jgi:hypothetical protein
MKWRCKAILRKRFVGTRLAIDLASPTEAAMKKMSIVLALAALALTVGCEKEPLPIGGAHPGTPLALEASEEAEASVDDNEASERDADEGADAQREGRAARVTALAASVRERAAEVNARGQRIRELVVEAAAAGECVCDVSVTADLADLPDAGAVAYVQSCADFSGATVEAPARCDAILLATISLEQTALLLVDVAAVVEDALDICVEALGTGYAALVSAEDAVCGLSVGVDDADADLADACAQLGEARGDITEGQAQCREAQQDVSATLQDAEQTLLDAQAELDSYRSAPPQG